MTEDKILLTARFVEGDLNEAELADFEARLQTDAELQQHLQDYRDVHQALQMQLAPDAQDAELKATLAKLNTKYFAQETKVVSLKPFIKWASGIAAVLMIGLFIWAPWRSSLYEEFNHPGQMLVTERGSASQTELDQAASLYNEGKYVQSKPLLARLYLKNPNDALLGYYYGQALMATEEVAKGRALLTKIYDGESAFKYDAAYAIALSYLKENNKDECKTWLQKVPEGTTHHEAAKDLLKKL